MTRPAPRVRRLLGGLLAVVVVAACSGDDGARTSSATLPPGVVAPGDPERVPLEGFDEVAITVESPQSDDALAWCLLAALDAERRSRGLMGVTELGGYEGMAFVYADDVERSFYMRDTPMPLSIAWVAEDGALVATTDMAPCEDRDGCPSYGAGGPYRYAIEVPQGDLPRLGIGEGATVTVGGACAPRS